MLINKDKSKKQANKTKFDNAPTLQNLKAVEEQFNRFAPALITVFKDVYKEWNPGTHLQIRTNKNKKITAYGTLHSNKEQFIQNYRNYERPFQNNTLICQFCGNKLTMWFWGEPEKERYIELWSDGFLLDGVEKKHEITSYGNFTEVDRFRNASLLSQCSAKNAHLGWKAKAAKQTGYQKVRMLFQHKTSKSYPNEDIKSVVDAYKICARFLKGYKVRFLPSGQPHEHHILPRCFGKHTAGTYLGHIAVDKKFGHHHRMVPAGSAANSAFIQ